MHEVFTRDQVEGESPNAWYSLFRYCDRLFEPKRRPHRDDEIAAIDLSQMSRRACYLLRQILILKRVYRDSLTRYPNLLGLHSRDLEMIHQPIVLAEPPRHSWAYFKRMNIWL